MEAVEEVFHVAPVSVVCDGASCVPGFLFASFALLSLFFCGVALKAGFLKRSNFLSNFGPLFVEADEEAEGGGAGRRAGVVGLD